MVIRNKQYFLVSVLIVMFVCVFALDDVRAAAEDDPLLFMVLFDEFEMRDPGADNIFSWSGQGWIGKDLTKFWFKFEGERAGGSNEEAEMQFLYSKAIAKYWDFQVGVRHDFDPDPSRTWATIGVQGLAPYFFETDVTLFIGDSGRTAFRLEMEYELLLTQRLVLTPDFEVDFYGKDDPQVGIGSGLSGLELGLRLRYEIRREFAPYVGVSWSKLFGRTSDIAEVAGEETSELQLLLGLRAWF